MEHSITRKPVPSAAAHRINEHEDGVAGPANPLLEKQGLRSHGYRWWTVVCDCVLLIPGMAFLVYAILIIVNTGRPITKSPLPMLMDAAAYGPTIFPIAFAAVAANILKAYSAWKLKRGISRLDLEYLLGSRTVVSALAAPFVLKSWSFLAPTLVILWAMSPLGGQAALRVIQAVPNTESSAQRFQWLDFMSEFPHFGPLTSAGTETIPAVAGAFSAALSTPMDMKNTPRDLFGHVKIPMVEVYAASEVDPDPEGWYAVNDIDNGDATRYAALFGLPLIPEGNFSQTVDYSLQIDTSYIYSNCVVSRGQDLTGEEWQSLMNVTRHHTNGKTLVLWDEGEAIPGRHRDSPLHLRLISQTFKATTNASCSLTMSHVQADIFCHQSACEAIRVRPVARAANVTIITALDGVGRDGRLISSTPPRDAFFATFVHISQTYWEHESARSYSTPIEYYFTNPASPFSPPVQDGWRGADIYPVGNALFSYRLTQLLNTLWLAHIGRQLLGSDALDFNVALADNSSLPQGSRPGMIVDYTYSVQGVAGTAMPDILIMRPNRAWLAVLILSSSLMLAAGVAAVAFGLLHDGQELLERATGLLDYDYIYSQGALVRRTLETLPESVSWRKQQVKLDLGEGTMNAISMNGRN